MVMLTCPFLCKIWTNLLSWWGLQWASPQNVEGLLDWWRGFKWRNFENKIWNAIPLAAFWSVWTMMNDCVFNGKQSMLEELSDLAKISVALWFKAYSKKLFVLCS